MRYDPNGSKVMNRYYRRSSIKKALKQIWLDAFEEAIETAKRNADSDGRWSSDYLDEVNFCRAKYQSYSICYEVKDKFRNYDRYCNGFRKNL